MNTTKYYIAAIAAFVIWGFFSFALKPLAGYESLDILFYRIFYAAIILVVLHLFARRKVVRENYEIFKSKSASEKRSFYGQIVGGGIFITANWLFFIYIINQISVKAGSFSYLICPIITSVLAVFILHEKLSKWQWIAVGLSSVSCFLLAMNHWTDLFYSLIVAFSYAFYLITQKKYNGIDKLIMLTLHTCFAAIMIFPFFPAYSGPMPDEPFFHISLLVIAIFFTILPLFLNLYALKVVSSSTVGIMLYINPIINFILAVFYYHEEVTEIQLLSYTLIIVSIVMFNKNLLLRQNYKVSAKID